MHVYRLTPGAPDDQQYVWRIEPDGLVQRTETGWEFKLGWRDVRAARFGVERRMTGFEHLKFYLSGAKGAEVEVWGLRSDDYAIAAERTRIYAAFVEEVADKVCAVNPNVRLHGGDPQSTRWIRMARTGGGGLLLAIFLGYLPAVAAYPWAPPLCWAAGVALAAWSIWRWRPQPTLPLTRDTLHALIQVA